MGKTEDIFSSFMVEVMNSQRSSMNSIKSILDRHGIDFVFIGGAILPEYNYSRFTEDVDILVDADQRQSLLDIPIGIVKFSRTGRQAIFHQAHVKVDIMYSGDAVGSSRSGMTFPKPKEITTMSEDGIPVLLLVKLIELKLGSGIYGADRLVDFGDIQRLISRNSLPVEFASGFRDDLKDKFVEIWNETTYK